MPLRNSMSFIYSIVFSSVSKVSDTGASVYKTLLLKTSGRSGSVLHRCRYSNILLFELFKLLTQGRLHDCNDSCHQYDMWPFWSPHKTSNGCPSGSVKINGLSRFECCSILTRTPANIRFYWTGRNNNKMWTRRSAYWFEELRTLDFVIAFWARHVL